MSTITRPIPIVTIRPATPARRALLAFAQTLARIAVARPDPAILAARAAAAARIERDRDRMASLVAPLR